MAQFDQEVMIAERQMRVFSRLVQTEKWQGVPTDKSMATYEVKHYLFKAPMMGEDLDYYRDSIKPNLPWADDHFDERVCGQPINPGIQWKKWPYAHSAERFLKNGKFNHNYMERYWPRHAGLPQASETPEQYSQMLREYAGDNGYENIGIYGRLGGLDKLVEKLAKEPYNRQSYLPV